MEHGGTMTASIGCELIGRWSIFEGRRRQYAWEHSVNVAAQIPAPLKRQTLAKFRVFRVPDETAFALQINIHPSPAFGAFCASRWAGLQPCSPPPTIFVQNCGTHIFKRVLHAGRQCSELAALRQVHLIVPPPWLGSISLS
jgi:hypothetical protein